jgi:hypothetical protein
LPIMDLLLLMSPLGWAYHVHVCWTILVS